MAQQTDEAYDIDDLNLEDIEDGDKLNEMHLIVLISQEKYALTLTKVREIVLLPDIIKLPSELNYFRGVIKVREDVYKLIDVRKRLGLNSLEEGAADFLDMLEERKQDHINWINELIASIDEKREFKLTTDPHACKFGKWYDSYQTDSLAIKDYLRLFDKPHKEIHKLAARVGDEIIANGYESAKKMISEAKNTILNEMINLFNNFKNILREADREIAIIVEHNEEMLALSVDKVDKIVNIDTNDIKISTGLNNERFFKGVSKNNSEIYIILDEEALLAQ